jgi:glycolate oxidase FAD binding subunit
VSVAVSTPALADVLAGIVGPAHLLADPAALEAHAVDGAVPAFVARPATDDEVSRLVMVAHAEGLAVSPRGSGSSLALGNPPRRLDLVIDVSRLDAIEEHSPADMVASVGAGARLGALGARFAEHGQMLAVDPPGGEARSVGGVLATGASGPRRFRYGRTRDLVLGVRFAQANGILTWGGAKVVKSVTGYDIPKLLTGSLGTLGIIVSATLRLHPRPPAVASWLVPFDTRASAEGFVAALLDSALEPDRIALLGGGARGAAGASGPGLAALVSLASVAEAVASQGRAIGRLAARHAAAAAPAPESAWGAVARALDRPVRLVAACDVARVVHWAEEMGRAAGGPASEWALAAEAGNGVIRAALADRGRAVLDVVARLREGLASEGGTLVVERAPAELKAGLDPWGPIGPGAFALMERIKREFDPAGILNPGRFVGGL